MINSSNLLGELTMLRKAILKSLSLGIEFSCVKKSLLMLSIWHSLFTSSKIAFSLPELHISGTFVHSGLLCPGT